MANVLTHIKEQVARWDNLSPLEKQLHHISNELSADDIHPRYTMYLKALLPIVESAVALEALQDEINLDMSDKAKPAWNALMEAIKAIDYEVEGADEDEAD